MPALRPGNLLLRRRYSVLSHEGSAANAEMYIVSDDMGSQFLVKAWFFKGRSPDPIQRALWDSELRMLYRVCSSPGADESLLVLKDSGIDADHRCFVMVLDAPGYVPLVSLLANRSIHEWLQTNERDNRRAVWKALRRMADGLMLLHDQRILHRNIDATAVYIDDQLGVDSMRLGGFEWSLRLGTEKGVPPPSGWPSPPEFFQHQGAVGYSLETDWFGFGLLAARCLLNLEGYSSNPPRERLKHVERAIRDARHLGEIEKALLNRLIAHSPKSRINHAPDILATIDDIDFALARPNPTKNDERRLILVFNPRNTTFIDDAIEAGFQANSDDSTEPYNPHNAVHVANLRSFIQNDLANAQLYAVPKASFYLLVGAQCIFRITKHKLMNPQRTTTTETWDYAFITSFGEVRGNDGGSQCAVLPTKTVSVRTLADINRQSRGLRGNVHSWEAFLPKIDRTAQQRAPLARFHDFIRCTNQLELLIRNGELFRYVIIDGPRTDDFGNEEVAVREVSSAPGRSKFFEIDGGMVEFLQREVDMTKTAVVRVALTTVEQDKLFLSQEVGLHEAWMISDLDRDDGVVRLHRVKIKDVSPPPVTGTLRSFGMFGQVALIRRRKAAIDNLRRHSFLLRSLSSPAQVYMDTGQTKPPMPVELPEDKVDQAKRAVIEDVLRVRPIYTLQGPPGTGKTTLVAHLLRQILADDSVAQILLTAQAHGAVDVLMNKVDKEAFVDVPPEDRPLAVRLGGLDEQGERTVTAVTEKLLEVAAQQLEAVTHRSPLQEQWRSAVSEMRTSIRSAASSRDAADFLELVKHGANITYCTTSARDLEELASTTQSFDWSIVEEAGKAHGFDLALPLQLGHRWLLIGDHRQLPPYRIEDYLKGIKQLDEAVQALEQLPDTSGLVDLDWIRKWREWRQDERREFQKYAEDWLRTFRQLFEQSEQILGRVTLRTAEGNPAGMLSGQHRMHPAIGTLISETYYKGQIHNNTEIDGEPLPRLVHPFVEPRGVAGRALIWVDLDWARDVPANAERGPKQGRPRYTNHEEVEALAAFLTSLRRGNPGADPVDVAVLSPYAQQVALLNRELRSRKLSLDGLRFKHEDKADGSPVRYAHTVDSFQGNQAGVICVSLVRNNVKTTGTGLGFLSEEPRLNVLLSRAEQLLVLVGSWEFFRNQVVGVDPSDTSGFLWHWWKVLDTFEKSFQSGAGVRLKASDLVGGQ